MTVELHVTRKGESTCVALLGEFEVEGMDELQDRLERVEGDHTRPVLDLRRLVVDQAFVERGMPLGNRPARGPEADA